MPKEKKNLKVETITLKQVPQGEKKSWVSIAFIWAGNVICVPALMVGGMITAGLNFKDSAIAMLLGYAITVCLMMLTAAQAARTGVPSTVAVSRALGEKGSQLTISLVLAFSMIGWYGYQTIVCASSFCSLLMNSFGISFPQWLACLIWGSLMLVTAVYGVGLTKMLNVISVPLLFVFLIYGVTVVMGNDGAALISAYEPSEPGSMMTGVTIAVGSFISASVTSGDYNRYSKNARSAALSCVIGIIPAGIGALVCGSILAICADDTDITTMFANIGLPIIGMLVLILATWSTNVGNAYSAGIAVVNALKLQDNRRAIVTAICGSIGILISLGGIVYYFVGFLSLLSYLITPVAALLVADYWLLGKGKTEDWKPFPGVNWIGIVSWIIGTLVTYFDTFFIPEIIGIIVTMCVYCVLCKAIKNPEYNPFVQN